MIEPRPLAHVAIEKAGYRLFRCITIDCRYEVALGAYVESMAVAYFDDVAKGPLIVASRLSTSEADDIITGIRNNPSGWWRSHG